MTKLAMFIQEQHKALKKERAANGGTVSEQVKQNIIKTYIEAGIMDANGEIRKEFR